jgi:DNA polymerase I-like protein with 3'-5' exonuclease and polymerase domains
MSEQYAHLKPLIPSELSPALNPTLVVNGAGLEKADSYLKKLMVAQEVPAMGFDYETNITNDFYERRARTIQFGDKDQQFVIDLLAFADGSLEKLSLAQGGGGTVARSGILAPVLDVVRPALETNRILKVGQNLPFEYEVSKAALAMRLWHLYSVDFAEKVMYAGLVHFKASGFWALDDIVARHFKLAIDKSEQKGFWNEDPLSEKQIIYCCLDTRLPLAIRQKQLPMLAKDGLSVVVKIENDALGAFIDMHINGMGVDKDLWQKRVDAAKAKHADNICRLDNFFIPIMGRKGIPDVDLETLENTWRELGVPSAAEKNATKEEKAALRAERTARKAVAKEAFYSARKKITECSKNIDTYEGQAAINYGSQKQLLPALWQMKGLSKTNLKDTEDPTLDKLSNIPVIAALREYRTTEKYLSTYGMSWLTKWSVKPGNELEKGQGWLHPKTGRIHSKINQLEAETGRTSSVQPNIQNVPKDDEARACFVADPPNEDIRITNCCDSVATWSYNEMYGNIWTCSKCKEEVNYVNTKAEEYCIVTVDMSGAELRIIADLANAKTWIDAFNKDWDVHSVSTEILYMERWLADACKGGEIYFDKEKGKEIELPPCAYFNKDHKKCKCPLHKELRDDTKATNFLLCYGGGPKALADEIKKSEEVARGIMAIHRQKFPDVWAFLDRSGKLAVQNLEARTMAGRRRLFEAPNYDRAEAMFLKDYKKRFKTDFVGKPDSHKVMSKLAAMYGSIERRGKNMGIQGANADIIKRAMGCGFDKDGKPYLWHILEPMYQAKLINMVHDELVVQCT